MIQVIFSSVKPPGRVNPAVQGFKQGFEKWKVKSPAILQPQWRGATNDWWHTLQCITIQTGRFSYRDQLVLKSFNLLQYLGNEKQS